jgi:acetate kinase
MQVLLTVNAGSSSVRLAAFAVATDADAGAPIATLHETTPQTDPRALLGAFVAGLPYVRRWTVAHRVVHGGPRLTRPCVIDAAVEAEIERLAPLAPLHNPAALTWLRACQDTLGASATQVAVFDTAFFANLPAAARCYALPYALADEHGLRRYGFHGLAHSALWHAWCAQSGKATGRAITLQLGSGCSMAAIEDGRPLDTSMGFSPLEGLVMATRPGDLDAGVLTYLQRTAGLSLDVIEETLARRSGLLGLSGISADMRVLLGSDDPRARLAVDVFCHRARKYLGAYLAVLGGTDAVLIGGGIGEHAPAIRTQILTGFEWAGMRLDAAANATAIDGAARCINAADSAVAIHVLPVDEAQVLVRAATPFVSIAA